MTLVIIPNYSLPNEFPELQIHSLVTGYHTKLSLAASGGRFRLRGHTLCELYCRWYICADLAQQFFVNSRERKRAKRSHVSDETLFDQYCVRGLKIGWGLDDAMKWVICRDAAILGSPMPASVAQSIDVCRRDSRPAT